MEKPVGIYEEFAGRYSKLDEEFTQVWPTNVFGNFHHQANIPFV